MAKRVKRKKQYEPFVDEELDLHGCTREEAREAIEDFLHGAKARGCERVRIIVGKGTRSTDGPVLPDVAKAVLVSHGLTYSYAKLCSGGEGALEVRL